MFFEIETKMGKVLVNLNHVQSVQDAQDEPSTTKFWFPGVGEQEPDYFRALEPYQSVKDRLDRLIKGT